MAQLRHLAILTHQPDRLADFYKRVFEMQELYRTKNGSVHLSDGEVNLAILNAPIPRNRGTTLVSITLASMWKTTKKLPTASARSIPKARQNSAKPLMPKVEAPTPMEIFSISLPWAGAPNAGWTSSRHSVV